MKKVAARTQFRFYRKPTDVFGLKYSPYLVLGGDDREEFPEVMPSTPAKEEWSLDNRKLLAAAVKALRPNATIVEIGVHRPENGWNSSTQTIFRSKREDVKYLGFDWQDRREVAKDVPNAKVFVGNTLDRDSVSAVLDNLDAKGIDLLVIDGGRSVNQVINDWHHASRVVKRGTVILHGTNYYPGPYVITNCIDPTKFRVAKHCETPGDLGVVLAVRK